MSESAMQPFEPNFEIPATLDGMILEEEHREREVFAGLRSQIERLENLGSQDDKRFSFYGSGGVLFNAADEAQTVAIHRLPLAGRIGHRVILNEEAYTEPRTLNIVDFHVDLDLRNITKQRTQTRRTPHGGWLASPRLGPRLDYRATNQLQITEGKQYEARLPRVARAILSERIRRDAIADDLTNLLRKLNEGIQDENAYM